MPPIDNPCINPHTVCHIQPLKSLQNPYRTGVSL